jgi:hypothetical protein
LLSGAGLASEELDSPERQEFPAQAAEFTPPSGHESNVQTKDFARVITTMARFGGRQPLLDSSASSVTYSLASGPLVKR